MVGTNGSGGGGAGGGGAASALETQLVGPGSPTPGGALRRMHLLAPRSSQLAHSASSAHAAQQSGAASTLTSLSSPSCGWGRHSGEKAALQLTGAAGGGASSACAANSASRRAIAASARGAPERRVAIETPLLARGKQPQWGDE